MTEDVKLIHMAEVENKPLENKPEVGFFTVKLFFPIFVLYSWKEVIMPSS